MIQLFRLDQLKENDVALIGICSDFNSSYLRGPSKAPAIIRETLFSGASNLISELGISIENNERFKDLGDHDIADTVDDFLKIEELILPIVESRSRPLVLGGDHAITFPIMKALSKEYGPVDILHFDAHPDIYHEFENNPYSHACPFARIMEQGLAASVTQVGIRTLNAHLREQVSKYGVRVIEMNSFDAASVSALEYKNPLYLSFDIDALDPAFAPGVSHHEPGGLSVRDVLSIIQSIKVPIIGADIVEYNPNRDINQMTATVAAKLLKEIAGKMLV